MVFDRKDTSPPQWTKFNVSRKGDGWELDWEADEAAKLTLKIDDSSFGGENTLYQAAKYEMDGIQSFRPSDSWLRGRIGENLKLIAILKDGNGNRTQPKIQFLGKGSPPDADIKISPNKDVFAPTEEITVSAKFNKGSYSHHYLEYNAKNMTDRDKKEAGCRRTGRVYKCTFLDTGSRQLKLTVADKKRYAAVFLQRTVTIKNLPVAQLTIKNKKNTYAEGQKLRVHIKASDSASKDGEVEAKLTMYWEITRNGKRQKFQDVIFRKMGGAVDSEIKKEVPESGSKVKLVLEVTDGDGLVNSKSVDFLVTEAERKEQKIEKKQENTKVAEEEKEQDTKTEEKAQQKEDKKQKSRRKKKKQIQKKKEKDIKTNPSKR